MFETYEIYLPQADGTRQFQALTCAPADLTREVQRLLTAADAASCEIYQFGRRLFTVEVGTPLQAAGSQTRSDAQA